MGITAITADSRAATTRNEEATMTHVRVKLRKNEVSEPPQILTSSLNLRRLFSFVHRIFKLMNS